jgi:hypothetical protein
MRRRLTYVAALSAAALAIAPAWSAGRTAQSESFFTSGDASAHWVNNDSSDPDDNRFSQIYDLRGALSYAGTTLHHVEGEPAPPTSPTFAYKADRETASGGSPRLVMVFGDPTTGATIGNIALTPDQWKQTWQDQGDGNWDVNGGTCGFVYHDDYNHAVSCMGPDAVVTSAFMVSDSTWLYPTGYKNWVDKIQYGGKTVSQPADNNNAPASG